MNAQLSLPLVTTAIRGGIQYLGRAQRSSGEFATFTGPDIDLRDAEPYAKSVYISTFVVHSLGYVPAARLVDRVRQGVGEFLEAEEEDNGTWNFDGRGNWRIPVDLESLCCVIAALLDLRRRTVRDFYRVLWQVVRPNEMAPGGPYFSYVGAVGVDETSGGPLPVAYAQEVDPLVNANVVFGCGRLGVALPGAADFVAGIVRDETFSERSRYCVSPHFPIYVIGRAYADADAGDLGPAMPGMLAYLLTKMPPVEDEVSSLNVACRAATLLNLGVGLAAIEPYVSELLRAQQADGGWPVWAAGAGFPLNWNREWGKRWPGGPASVETGWCWGSPALTTALALEVLGKYQGRAGERR